MRLEPFAMLFVESHCKAAFSAPLLLVLCSAIALIGCGASAPPMTVDHSAPLGKIYDAYLEATTKLGHPPRNLEELKPHLALAGDVETLLISPRDQQPYVILWNVNPFAEGFDLPPPLIAYEAQGAGGERYAINLMGYAILSDQQLAEYGLPK